ncbi:hypothetical protein EYF80_026095 [Liparis tanakae]|uniref:Uncharacterized protein n=1 Tax=Liparis tanakae TaxID=230148 RepID=A0A4Z2HCR8_9TELE|nr:hypothetical protein EYF80_026095 [Liparis tanakae]
MTARMNPGLLPPDLKQQTPQHASAQVVHHYVQPGTKPGGLAQPAGHPAVHSCTEDIREAMHVGRYWPSLVGLPGFPRYPQWPAHPCLDAI